MGEAAGLNICLHGVFETGITTCASYHAAVTLPNLDDTNQIMCQLHARDVVASPGLCPRGARLTLPAGGGLGFELEAAAVEEGERRYER